MRNSICIGLLFFLVVLLFTSGCVSNPLGKPIVKIDSVDSTPVDMAILGDRGIQYLITVKAHNEGDGLAKNVKVTVYAKDANDKILGSESIFIGNIEPGESKTGTTKMWVNTSVKKFSARYFPII